MAYCGPRGLPHSFFLGGPHRWTDADRDKALAWAAQERSRCGGCGTRKAEWDEKRGGDRKAYRAEADICPGCEQTERKQHQLTSDEAWKHQRGKRVVLVPNGDGGGRGRS
jgi:hypothetical protein